MSAGARGILRDAVVGSHVCRLDRAKADKGGDRPTGPWPFHEAVEGGAASWKQGTKCSLAGRVSGLCSTHAKIPAGQIQSPEFCFGQDKNTRHLQLHFGISECRNCEVRPRIAAVRATSSRLPLGKGRVVRGC